MKNKTPKLNTRELLFAALYSINQKIKDQILDDVFIDADLNIDGEICYFIITFDNSNHFVIDENQLHTIYETSEYDFSLTMHHVIYMAKQQYGEIDDVTIDTYNPLINYDINNVYLQVVPNTDDHSNTMIFPLAFDTQICATYRYYLGRDANKIRSIPITPKIFDTYFSMYNLGDFFRIAQNNTRRLFPLNILKLEKEWELTHKQMGYSVEESQDKISRLSKHDYVYAATTPERVYASNIFLMPELLTSFSAELGTSFFIVPTLDMVFLFSAHNPLGSNLTELVQKINVLAPERYLSDQLYYFNHHSGTIHIYK